MIKMIKFGPRPEVKIGTLLLCLVLQAHLISTNCPVREPVSASGTPQQDDAGFYLTVSGNPESYKPGELYTISLKVSVYLILFQYFFPKFCQKMCQNISRSI